MLGPTIDGLIAESMGLQSSFFVMGGLMLVAFMTTALFVKESFHREDKKTLSIKEIWSSVPEKSLTLTLFVTFFILTLALYSVEPIITVYVTQLSKSAGHVALILVALFAAGLLFIPQAVVQNPWQLMGLRFLLGLAAGWVYLKCIKN